MIYLIRHGETTLNAARVLQFPDTPLSERGIGQAERLAARIAALGVRGILASDHLRTRMTADAVSRACAIPVTLSVTLRERDFGDHRGRSYDDLKVNVFAPDHEPPGGETWAQFHGRVALGWTAAQTFATAIGGPVAIVSHALFCRALVERHLPLAAGVTPVPRWGNTAVTTIERNPDWQVTRLACTAHLDGHDTGAAQA